MPKPSLVQPRILTETCWRGANTGLLVLRFIYSVLIHLIAPFALLLTAVRSLRDRSVPARLMERYGYTAVWLRDRPFWIHAVSVGEVQAAAALIRVLRVAHPQRSILVTTATTTGAQRVRALFGADVHHAYLPYDLPGSVQRFLARTRPGAALIVEREIWPNLFRECERMRIPMLLVSARLSPNSSWRSPWASRLLHHAFERNVTVAAQTADDAQRYIELRVPADRVHVTGNIKFDLEIAADVESGGAALRTQQFAGRPVWIAGSTHAGEETLLLEAHEQIRTQLPTALFILVPRHPPRFAEVAQLLESRGVAYARRSTDAVVQEGTSVLLVDTLGELLLFYAAADVAFVAGSLVPIGGHNLLEPAALARPIVIGPHNFNAPDIAALFLQRGAALEVPNARELSEQVVALLRDRERAAAMGQRARVIVEENRGAVARTLALVAAL